MADASLRSPVHPVLRVYADRNLIEAGAFRSDGSLGLVFDSAYRVILRPAPDGRILVLSPVFDLAGLPEPELEDFLLRMLRAGAGLLRDHACGLALDEDRNRLVLQQIVPGSATVQNLEDQLADFLSILAFWRSLCLDAAAGRSG